MYKIQFWMKAFGADMEEDMGLVLFPAHQGFGSRTNDSLRVKLFGANYKALQERGEAKMARDESSQANTVYCH